MSENFFLVQDQRRCGRHAEHGHGHKDGDADEILPGLGDLFCQRFQSGLGVKQSLVIGDQRFQLFGKGVIGLSRFPDGVAAFGSDVPDGVNQLLNIFDSFLPLLR